MQDEEPAPVSKVSRSQGVLIGTGNVQHNTFMSKPAPDLASLIALAPDEAVVRIRRMSHDDVVDVLAMALPADIPELFKALVAADEALVVAVLVRIRRDKAEELISLYAPRLKDLHTAAIHIDGFAKLIEWHRDGYLERDGGMYRRRYEEGCIFWTVEDGVTQISHRLMAVYESADFGRPIEGNGETYHFFEKGTIFLFDQRAISITGDIYKEWRKLAIGFPLAAREDSEDHSRQHWAAGTIYESKHGTFFVRSDLDIWGGGTLPTSDQVEVTSQYQTRGVLQQFSRKLRFRDYYQEVLICSTKKYGKFDLVDHILMHYMELGGAESWLGFPISQQEHVQGEVWLKEDQDYSAAWLQRFEGGFLYHPDGHPPAAVPTETLNLIGNSHDGPALGWPVSEDLPVGHGGDRIQFFERGAVVLRDGQREVLVRRDRVQWTEWTDA